MIVERGDQLMRRARYMTRRESETSTKLNASVSHLSYTACNLRNGT